MKQYVLSSTDGYGIDTKVYDSMKEARNAMTKAYQESYPVNNDESSAEMSYIGPEDAILYRNGEDVLVWDITEVKDDRTDTLIRNLAELLRECRGDLYNREFADYLISEAGFTLDEISGCGIMDADMAAGAQ